MREKLSTNTLIVSIVGMMFALCVVVVLGAFSFCRKWSEYHHVPKHLDDETKEWPAQ